MTNKQLYELIRKTPATFKGKASSMYEIERRREAMMGALKLLEDITPRMLLQVFPVAKDYDGKKHECKDYFYTMDAMKKHGLDAPMGESVFDVLWDYWNHNVSFFVIWCMGVISNVRIAQGEKDILTEWLEDQGIPSYYKHTTDSGKEIRVNSMTGEAFIVEKPKPKMPRWWKVIEGGAK